MSLNNRKKIYFIVGPTSSGKTAMSIELAKKIKEEENVNCEIISADSRQIFKDLNLSTGKVTQEEMENIPHHMLDIINPGQYFSVVDFTNMALKIIDEIFSRGNTPIICGGTGFYIDSLLYEYNLPDIRKDDKLRDELDSKTQIELFEILVKLDPKYAKKIEDNFEYRNNKHRMMRTIEVVKGLGYFPPLNKTERFDPKVYDAQITQPQVSREELRKKIYKRLIDRIDQGMIEEIQSVKEKYNLTDEYLLGLGLEFKWTAKYLNKEITKEEMIEKLSIEIGQYAKRQTAWFKRYF